MNEFVPDQLLAVHRVLAAAKVPHAFGGAVAFAYYGEPRATFDLDLNIALPPAEHRRVLDALESLFTIAGRGRHEQEILQRAQTRLRWDHLPVDLFFADVPFHASIAARVKAVDFMGVPIEIISAEDLIICKAGFDRPKDWLDIDVMFRVQGNRLDRAYLRHWIDEFFAPDDSRRPRLDAYRTA